MKLIFILILLNIPVFAVDPKTTIEVNPPFIGTNETAEIIITSINEEFQEPPKLSMHSANFDIAFLNISVMNKIVAVNGKITQEKKFQYIYQLVPKKSGKFLIPAFIGILNSGKEVYTESAQIEIKPVDHLQAPRSSMQNIFSLFNDIPREIFLFSNVETKKVQQNTPLLVDTFVYSDAPNFLRQVSSLTEVQKAIYNGGVSYEIPISEEERTLESSYFGHSLFYGKLYKRYIIYPLKTGQTFFTPPVASVSQQLNQFYVQGDPIEITSEPVRDRVVYVGNELTAEINLSTNIIKTSEEGLLTLILRGSGNTDFFTNPLKNVKIENLFISEPQTKIDISIDSNNSAIFMTKTFTYSVIPKKGQVFTIPSLEFTITTPSKQTKTIITKPLSFEGIDNSFDRDKQNNVSFVKKATLDEKYYYSSGLLIFLVSMLMGSLMMFWAWVTSKKNARLATDDVFARQNNANNKMISIIKEADIAIKESKFKDGARLLRQSIINYCTDKFRLAPSSSPTEIFRYFNEHNINFSLKNKFLDFLSELEFHAFGQEPSKIKIETYKKLALEILHDLSKIK